MGRNQINLCIIAAFAAALAGCGGSGGGGGTNHPVGKPAFRAITLSGYQSQVAATKYVLPLLVAGAPAGSGIHLGRRPGKGAGPGGIGFDPDLNLYYRIGIVGPTWTMSFFTDANATVSAGFARVTIENATTFDTNYLTYPATLDLSENITAGNLVSNGTGTLIFTDSSGSNTLAGVLNAPGRGIHAVLDMSLDNSGNVGGSITVVQNGLTAVVTGLSGSLEGSFTGNAAVSPGNLTGTATINLLQGTYELTINDPSGLQGQGAVDAAHNLLINYNDGTSLSLSDALNQPVMGAGSNGGGGTSSYTITPISGNPWEINAVASDGKMVGQIGTFLSSLPYYWDSPSATPQAVSLDATLTNIVVTGVNGSGQLVGHGLDSTSHFPVALYWASFNQAPVRLTAPSINLSAFGTAQVFLQSSGRIVVTYPTPQFPGSASYVYSGANDANPYPVIGGYITHLSDGNAALGVDTSSNKFSVWKNLSPSETPIAIPDPQGAGVQTANMGLDGTVAAAGLTNTAWVVAGPNYTTAVNLHPPVTNAPIGVFGVGPSGQVLGFASTDLQPLDNEGVIWANANATPVILRSSSTPNVIGANFETNSGILIVNCITDPNGPTFHLSIMTPK